MYACTEVKGSSWELVLPHLHGLQGSESVQQANAVSIVTYFYQKDEPCFWCPIVFLGRMNVSRVVCTYPLSAGVEH